MKDKLPCMIQSDRKASIIGDLLVFNLYNHLNPPAVLMIFPFKFISLEQGFFSLIIHSKIVLLRKAN